jgi:hypothetical protein
MKTVRYKATYFSQVKGGANPDNFYIRSLADFSSCSIPEMSPDFTSDSGSSYWYTTEGVIRASDHWGGVASCRWTLDGTETKNESPVAGFCRWDEIALTVSVDLIAEFPVNAKIKVSMDFNGRKVLLGEKVA